MSVVEAEKAADAFAREYIHNQNESEQKMRSEERGEEKIIVISKDVEQISRGWVYNATIKKPVDQISFHIGVLAKEKVQVKKEMKVNASSSKDQKSQEELIKELRKVFESKK